MKFLWSGRFSKELYDIAKKFTFSIGIDKNLAEFDVSGSIAHVEMLVHQRIISRKDGSRIIKGLKKIQDEIKENKFVFKPNDEDIHTAVERRLFELIGPVAGNLHTARSRNDQIVLDEKLYLKKIIPELESVIVFLQKTLVKKAEEYFDVILPELTHFQPAQPVLFSHHLLAYVCMLERDKTRLRDTLARLNIAPLGACACTGTSFNINPGYIARQFGFDDVFTNSVDVVSDRDFILETISNLGILMIHLSRMAEELIFWHSSLLGFVDLPDEFCTGSSIMPQKKNPDVLELIRGKTAVLIGNIAGIFALMKGLPLSYNRDMQEDKRFLFESCEISHLSTLIVAKVIEKMKININKMAQACNYGYIEATDIAEFLVRKGIPFRQSHHMVAELVKIAIEKNISLKELDEITIERITKVKDTVSFIKNIRES
ncbi:MAG: argininosuccinate lyase [Candidatus Omnitrophica bacterium]|nr:argininosuccinate lyase [Candidatus Omnitrophota bacterium]